MSSQKREFTQGLKDLLLSPSHLEDRPKIVKSKLPSLEKQNMRNYKVFLWP